MPSAVPPPRQHPGANGKSTLLSLLKWAVPALLVVPFLTLPAYQADVCQIGPLVAAQADEGWRATTVRKICFYKSSWSPTTAEASELVDAFLAKASGAQPTSAFQFYATDVPVDAQRAFDKILAPVLWAERMGPARRTNSDTFRVIYKLYYGNRPQVPAAVT
jgi:hypothetical protein